MNKNNTFRYITSSEKTGTVNDISLVPLDCTTLDIVNHKENLDFSAFESLKVIRLTRFDGEKIEGCSNVEFMFLHDCNNLKSLPSSSNLLELSCTYCNSLEKISNFPILERLQVLSSSVTAIFSLPELLFLDISGCSKFVAINTCENVVTFKCNNSKVSIIPSFPKLNRLECNNCKELGGIPELKSLKYLSCESNEQIKKIPEIETLIELDCSNSGIKTLPVFNNLKILKCIGCPIRLIKSMPSLEYLNCKNSGVEIIKEMPNLKILNCSDCEDLNEIKGLNSIEVFTCENCENLNEIPILSGTITLGGCPKIKAFLASHVKSLVCILCEKLNFVFISSSKNIETIRCIDCVNLRLISTDEFPDLSELKFTGCNNLFFTVNGYLDIDLEDVDFSNIPTDCIYLYSFNYSEEGIDFSRFPDLKILIIEDFKSEILNFGNVEKLNIKNSNLGSLPPSKHINLLQCESTNLKTLSDFPALTELSLTYCKSDTKISKCENIIILECYDCLIFELPDLPNLKKLTCKNCPELKEIPEYNTLETLICSDLKIRKLPALNSLLNLGCTNCLMKEIPFYEKLKGLYCATCLFLETIPEYRNLNYFICKDNNKIVSLPLVSGNVEIKNCSNLESIVLFNLNNFICMQCPKLITVFITESTDIKELKSVDCRNLILIMADVTLRSVDNVSVTGSPDLFLSEKLRINGAESTINGILSYILKDYLIIKQNVPQV